MNKLAIDIKLTLVTAFFLIGAMLFKLPYGYYTILRIVVCAYFFYASYLIYNKEKISCLCLLSVLIAVVYNPFIKIALSKEVWLWVNGLTLLFLFVTGFKKSNKK